MIVIVYIHSLFHEGDMADWLVWAGSFNSMIVMIQHSCNVHWTTSAAIIHYHFAVGRSATKTATNEVAAWAGFW